MGSYEFRHIICFDETNLLGNVYYVSHVQWQGRCRELFLREYAPEILREFDNGLCLVTTRCSCEYLAELSAFEEVVIRMSLKDLVQNRMVLQFEYWRESGSSGEELVARGEQHIACMRRHGGSLVAAELPATLESALSIYANT